MWVPIHTLNMSHPALLHLKIPYTAYHIITRTWSSAGNKIISTISCLSLLYSIFCGLSSDLSFHLLLVPLIVNIFDPKRGKVPIYFFHMALYFMVMCSTLLCQLLVFTYLGLCLSIVHSVFLWQRFQSPHLFCLILDYFPKGFNISTRFPVSLTCSSLLHRKF